MRAHAQAGRLPLARVLARLLATGLVAAPSTSRSRNDGRPAPTPDVSAACVAVGVDLRMLPL